MDDASTDFLIGLLQFAVHAENTPWIKSAGDWPGSEL
jgi:hypothetical protein